MVFYYVKFIFGWIRCVLVNILCWLTLLLGFVFKILSKPIVEISLLPLFALYLIRYHGLYGGAPDLVHALKLFVSVPDFKWIIGGAIFLFILVRIIYVKLDFRVYPAPVIYGWLRDFYMFIEIYAYPPYFESSLLRKTMSPSKMKKMMERYKGDPLYVDFDNPNHHPLLENKG